MEGFARGGRARSGWWWALLAAGALAACGGEGRQDAAAPAPQAAGPEPAAGLSAEGAAAGLSAQEQAEMREYLELLAKAESEAEFVSAVLDLDVLDSRAAIPHVAKYLADPRPYAIEWTLFLIEDLGGAEAVRAVAAVFDGPGNEEGKVQAAGSLWRLRDDDDPQGVVDGLMKGLADPSPRVRKEAGEYLALLQDPIAMAAVVQAYRAETDDARRTELAQLLREMGASSLPAN